MKHMLSIALGLAIVASVCVQTAAGQVDGIPPESVTENFYYKYLQLRIRGLPDKDTAFDLTRFFTRQINQLIKRDIKKRDDFIKANPGEKPPWTDGDIFTSLFEGATSYSKGRTRGTGDSRTVDVRLVYDEGGKQTKWTDTVVLQKVGKRWRISNIIFKGKWQFKSGSSLLNVLQ